MSEINEEFNTELSNFLKTFKNIKENIFSVTANYFVNDLINLINNYVTILRVLSYIFRFVNNSKNPLYKSCRPLSNMEIIQAENHLLRAVQEEEFDTDIRSLQFRGLVNTSSKLKSLNPFLDECRVLLFGGRLGNSDLNFFFKHPVILLKLN